MSKVIISSSVNVPYSFKDKSGKEVSGSNNFAMISDGFGIPKVVKCTAPLTTTVEVDRDDVVYDFKQRLKTDLF